MGDGMNWGKEILGRDPTREFGWILGTQKSVVILDLWFWDQQCRTSFTPQALDLPWAMARGHRLVTTYRRVGRKREPGRPWWVTTHPQFIPGGPGGLQVSIIRISLSPSHLQLYEIKIPFARH